MKNKESREENPDLEASAESATDKSVETVASDEQPDVEGLLAQLAEQRERALRAQAEFENAKKRNQAQQAMALARASERVVTALIPALDDLDFAIAHAQETGSDMLDGLQAIHAKLIAVFNAESVQVVDPLGQPFDHDTAQAVQMVEDATQPDQTVTQVIQKGYVMGAAGGDSVRVLRPAMVIVSTNPGA